MRKKCWAVCKSLPGSFQVVALPTSILLAVIFHVSKNTFRRWANSVLSQSNFVSTLAQTFKTPTYAKTEYGANPINVFTA